MENNIGLQDNISKKKRHEDNEMLDNRESTINIEVIRAIILDLKG